MIFELICYSGLILGCSALFIASLKTSILVHIVQLKSLKNWIILRSMILAFLFGYVIYLATIATKEVTILEVVVVAIFLIGSLFVLLVVNSAFYDIQIIRNSKDLLETRNYELQMLNNQLDSFLYSTAHDLRAPLATMLGLVDLGTRSNSYEEKDKYYKMIAQTINNMELLLKDIISITKNKHLEIKYQSIQVSSVIESVISELEPIRDGDLTTTVSLDFEDNVWIDVYRTRSILYNLISNSFRFFDRTKKEKWVLVKVSKTRGELRFSVSDNGAGIDKAFQERVFDMFYRANQDSMGSGLGLYMTREIVQTLGGNLGLTSTPGVGTEVIARLPYPPIAR